MPIKNLSEVRRLPRLGKIHLGVKVKKINEDKEIEYPKEVSYFVCPEKVQKVFGKEPKELRIMFPIENHEIFFQQWYKSYGYSLLKCKGDGQRAFTWDEKEGGLKEIPCPCSKLEARECSQIGILQFLLPEVDGAGVWQITTGSRNSIIDLNSSIDFVRALCGRIRMIPLVLKRIGNVIQRIGEDGKPHTSKHYTMQIDVQDISIKKLQQFAKIKPEEILLPPPDELKDELFFPKNGFELIKEKEEAKPIQEEKSAHDEFALKPDDSSPVDLHEMKIKLNELITVFKNKGGKLSQITQDKICAFKSPDQFIAAIEFYEKKLKEMNKTIEK